MLLNLPTYVPYFGGKKSNNQPFALFLSQCVWSESTRCPRRFPYMRRCLFVSFFLITGSGVSVWAQSDSSARTHQFATGVSTILTSGRTTPFWMRANQYATVPLQGSVGTVRFGVSSEYRPAPPGSAQARRRAFDWGYGLDVVANTTPFGNRLVLPEAYVKGRWRQIEAYIGRRRSIVGLVDTTLTSGAYAVSGNALPVPVIQFSTRGYVPIPFTKGVVSINAQFGSGWFYTGQTRVWHTMLNQSAIYAKVGKASWPVRLFGGLSHEVVWGGYSPTASGNVSNQGKLPSSFNAFLYAATGLAYPGLSVDPNVSSIDEGNRIGNHLGSLDLGAEFEVGNTTVMVYRQNPYDTGALFYLTTLADGLNGLSICRKTPSSGFFSVDRALVEFLYTANQGGDVFVLGVSKLQGRVDYFNNQQLIDGWTYYDRTIGTPFLTSANEVRPDLPTGRAIANNRVSMLHLALKGRIAGGTWLLRLANSQNLGTYILPFPAGINQFSAQLELASPAQLPIIGGVELRGRLAIDRGTLLPDATGLSVGISKNWSVRP